MTTDISIHLNDINNDDTFPVTIWSNVIPRKGDEVYYWVDYPTHMTRAQRGLQETEPGEPQRVTGLVEKVAIEYRVMDYGTRTLVTMVSVFLSDYLVETYPEQSKL
jgi:hypothetical protein